MTGDQWPAVPLVASSAPAAPVVLAPLRVDSTTNEPKAALELLGRLPVAGAVVTADAMVTHADLGREVRKARGDSRRAVRDNPPTVRHDIEAVFAADAAVSPLPAAPA